MSAAITPQVSWPSIHRQFEAALPQIDNTIKFQFRHWPRRRRAEAIADARAACWHAWYGLVARGRDPLAIGPTGIAFNACRYVKGGRRLGTGPSGRGTLDVYDHRARRRLGVQLLRLHRDDQADETVQPGDWREWLVEDNRTSPADEAAFRLDFATWLEGLPARKRQMAELLVLGHETGTVAASLGVSSGAVSQTRAWLARSWHDFQNRCCRP